jgi:hypothetical protein
VSANLARHELSSSTMPERRPARTSSLRRSRRVKAAIVALVVPAIVGLVAEASIAQTRRGGGAAPRTPPASRSATPKADAGAVPGALAAPTPAAAPTAAPTPVGDGGAGVVESKTLDGGTHVFKFSELDIEGRLKSPQLVYFLRRVRAEFAAGELGHRTFLREMSETRKEPTF